MLRRTLARLRYLGGRNNNRLVFIGFLFGLMFSMCFQIYSSNSNRSNHHCQSVSSNSNSNVRIEANSKINHKRSLESNRFDGDQKNGHNSKQLIFVGVMTSVKYLNSRARAIYDTWAQNFPGQIRFFVGESSSNSSSRSNLSMSTTTWSTDDLPIIQLKGVDDSAYPPQKKSFLMLKYMFDNFGHQFEFFMRADDDMYVRGDRLEMLLRSINSSRTLYIGQAGLGNRAEYGQLSLGDTDNYCMGGTGMILSQTTLAQVVPHIRHCLRSLYTTHEDVEVGRCIRKFADVSCTWSYEMQQIFFNTQTDSEVYESADLQLVTPLHHAVTLHPFKQPRLLRHMHAYMRRLNAADLRYRTVLLKRDIFNAANELTNLNSSSSDLSDLDSIAQPPSLNNFFPQRRDEVLQWDFLSSTVFHCADMVTCPRHNIQTAQKYALDDVIRQALDILNKNARQRGRLLEYQEILYGYRRVNPLHSVDYILDMLLVYKRFKGQRLTVPVRRHSYLQQTFADLVMVDDSEYWTLPPATLGRAAAVDNVETSVIVNVVVPLSGRVNSLRRFLANFEQCCLTSTTLTIVLFPMSAEPSGGGDDDVVIQQSVGDDEVAIRTILHDFQRRHAHHFPLRLLDATGAFSRGRGLSLAASTFPADALMFFTDVDVVFNEQLLRHVRLNTRRHRQVYFPMAFSEFDPRTWHLLQSPSNVSVVDFGYDHFQFDRDRGYFRHFGFGLVSLFNSDYNLTGGYNLDINGWGLEDVDLFEKFMKLSNLTLFRAPEPNLVHVYHPVNCDSKLSAAQFEMCRGSKAASYASAAKLAELVYSNADLSKQYLTNSMITTTAN